ncbi:MAG: O-sialoglycoprotein endopeptidase [Parcubacteria bacterium C7867-001]|nr:MAG: O-sialoglycoprotein endopeptidase [Parcubacteria bacterium C7867-001]
MKLLAIETSCDETAVAVLEANGDEAGATFNVLGNALISQIDIHKEYGGVFPAIAKREHAKNLVPLLEAALEEAEMLREDTQVISPEKYERIVEILSREPDLTGAFFAFVNECEKPAIDAITVTHGPGLEPALWVGVNFARALSVLWDIPVVGVNHMEGHFLVALAEEKDGALSVSIPEKTLGLLISGGHTELDLRMEDGSYKLLGQTRDDAVGEAFDKVARMMDLPYPGGPEVSKLAERHREDSSTNPFQLPRPMIHEDNCDFSFSGLKTSVLYKVKEIGELSELQKEQLSMAFEDAAADVLYAKTLRALEETGARALIIGGGVSANTHIRRVFTDKLRDERPDVSLFIPRASLTGDNAIMIGVAGYFRALKKQFADIATLRADGNLSLSA